MPETIDILQQFAALLASETDDAARARLIARAKMLGAQDAPDEAFEPPVTSLADYLATPIENPPSLVYPTICVRGEITATLGRAGKGKTTMNLNRLLRWGAGLPMYDGFCDSEGKSYLAPEEPIRSLIIENEGSAGMFHHKMGVMMNAPGHLSAAQRKLAGENVLVWGNGGYQGVKFDEQAWLDKIRRGLEKHQPDILFVEPFRSLWKGEENSSTDMAIVVDNMVAMATDYKCAVILSHHERKSGAGDDGELMSAGRGSTVLEGVVALMENFQSVKAGDFREITWSKARYLQPPPPVRLEFSAPEGWYRWCPDGEVDQSILEVLGENSEEPMNRSDLAEITGETKSKLNAALNRLVKDKKVKQHKSIQTGAGSTGYRYSLAGADTNEGLGF